MKTIRRKIYSKELLKAYKILGRKTTNRKKPTPIEHREQCQLAKYVQDFEEHYPVLKLLQASFNPGKMSWHMSKKMQAEGAKAGFPDLHLACARKGKNALFIEMKRPKGTLTPKQKKVFPLLAKEGNLVVICRSWEQAFYIIVDYLGLPICVPETLGSVIVHSVRMESIIFNSWVEWSQLYTVHKE